MDLNSSRPSSLPLGAAGFLRTITAQHHRPAPLKMPCARSYSRSRREWSLDSYARLSGASRTSSEYVVYCGWKRDKELDSRENKNSTHFDGDRFATLDEESRCRTYNQQTNRKEWASCEGCRREFSRAAEKTDDSPYPTITWVTES